MGIFRFLFAASVVSTHTASGYNFLFSRFGELSVNSFFIISGFYMALILTEKYTGKNGSYRLFITNRFLRIYPIYWVVLLGSIILSFVFNSGQFPYTSIFSFLSDATLLIRTDYFSLKTAIINFPWITPAWTLVIELTFYLLAPFFIRLKTSYIIGIALLSLAIRFGIIYYELVYSVYEPTGFFPACLVFFLMGILAYRLYIRIKVKRVDKKIIISFFIAMILLTFFYDHILSLTGNHHVTINLMKQWLYYGIFTTFVPFGFLLLKSNPVDRFIGELSYPIYISHFAVIEALEKFFGIKTGTWQLLLITFAVTILVSLILVYGIDKPMDRYRQKRLKYKLNKKRVPRKNLIYYNNN